MWRVQVFMRGPQTQHICSTSRKKPLNTRVKSKKEHISKTFSSCPLMGQWPGAAVTNHPFSLRSQEGPTWRNPSDGTEQTLTRLQIFCGLSSSPCSSPLVLCSTVLKPVYITIMWAELTAGQDTLKAKWGGVCNRQQLHHSVEHKGTKEEEP